MLPTTPVPRSLRPTMLETSSATITGGHTEFTFVPADYTVECSDEMPMDDATASDNCGEVTIECPVRLPAMRGQLHHRAHVH